MPVATPTVVLFQQLVAEQLGDAGVFFQVADGDLVQLLLAQGHFVGHFAADAADLPLQVAHPGFPGVEGDDVLQRPGGELDPMRVQAVGLDLARDQVAAGDLDFFLLGVAVDLDDLHAVAEGRLDRFHQVGRGDEQHFGKVEGHAQVMVGEGVVLLRVQDFQQGRGRVAAEIHADLVHFVHHEYRVVGAGVLQFLDDFPGRAPT